MSDNIPVSTYTNTFISKDYDALDANVWLDDYTKPRLFALLIGIDGYSSSPLKGAVADANKMAEMLRGIQGFSMIKVETLLDECATRSAIIEALENFQENNEIEENDAIVIFFAGHGGRSEVPRSWNSPGDMGEYLIPYDYDEDSGKVPPIPDRTLGLLLRRIAIKKGNNITVILDCCHSASGTRELNQEEPDGLERGIPIIVKNHELLEEEAAALQDPQDSDSDPTCDRGLGPSKVGFSTHVLLAACRSAETAKEDNRRGLFTSALINAFQAKKGAPMTYASLIRDIGPLNKGKQNPQCEGHNQHFICFTSAASGGQPLYQVNNSAGRLQMHAGTAEGITEDAHFDIYDNSDRAEVPLCRLRSGKPDLRLTYLLPIDNKSYGNLPEKMFTVQVKAGRTEKLCVYTRNTTLLDQLKALELFLDKTTETDARIILVQTEIAAHVVLDLQDDGSISFDSRYMMDRVGSLYKHMTPRTANEDLRCILIGTAHYHWHLRRENNISRSSQKIKRLRDSVQVKFFKLQRKTPGEEGLQPLRDDLIRNGTVYVDFDDEVEYGVEISSHFKHNIYPWIFFFDNHDFSISVEYKPAEAARHVEPSLSRFEKFTLGYGSGGGKSLVFTSPSKQKVELGFLKIFLCTERISLSHVGQTSPFDDDRTLRRGIGDTISDFDWDTVVIPIVQKSPDLSLPTLHTGPVMGSIGRWFQSMVSRASPHRL